MTRRPFVLAVIAAMILAAVASLRANEERLKNSAVVLDEMSTSVDKGIPTSLVQKAQCVAIIPGVKKAALGVGGQYGRGYLACRKDGGGWSAPGAIRVEGGSVGLQIGGSDTDVVLLVMNPRGAERPRSSRFTDGADAAVAAGPVGREAAAQTDATMMAEILAWSRSRGIFAGISLKGSTLREDSGENKTLYGKEITNRDVVAGKVSAPTSADVLMKALAKY